MFFLCFSSIYIYVYIYISLFRAGTAPVDGVSFSFRPPGSPGKKLKLHNETCGKTDVASQLYETKQDTHKWLACGFKHFLFSPRPGEMIQFDYLIFFRWVETTKEMIMDDTEFPQTPFKAIGVYMQECVASSSLLPQVSQGCSSRLLERWSGVLMRYFVRKMRILV